MNEDALKDAYALFRSDGYGDSIEDFKLLISQNEDALKDAYALFRSDGYGDSIEDFKLLIGVKKKGISEPVGDTEGTTASTTEQAPASPTSSDSQQSILEPSTFDPSKFVAPEERLVDDAYIGDTRTRDADYDLANKAADEALLKEQSLLNDADRAKQAEYEQAKERISPFEEIARGYETQSKIQAGGDIASRNLGYRPTEEVARKIEDITLARDERESKRFFLEKEADYDREELEAIERDRVEDNKKLQSDKEFIEDLESIDYNLINSDEEVAKVALAEKFGKYGFLFKETGAGDALEVISKNNERYEVDLQKIISKDANEIFASDQSEIDGLKDFIKKNSFASNANKIYDEEVLQQEQNSEKEFFSKRGLNYDLLKEKTVKEEELRDKLSFLENAPYNNSELSDIDKEKYKDFFRNGFLIIDREEVQEKMSKEINALDDFFDDDDIKRAKEDWDVLQNSKQKAFKENVGESVDIIVAKKENLDKIYVSFNEKFIEDFGKDYSEVNPTTLNTIEEKKLYDKYSTSFSLIKAENSKMAVNYELAKTYIDTKFDKNLQQEFVENVESFDNAISVGWNTGKAQEVILKAALGLTDVSDDATALETAEGLIKYLDAANTGNIGRAQYRFNTSKGFVDAWRAFRDDPVELSLALAAESMTMMLPYGMKIVGSTAAAGTAAGAALGSAGFALGPTGLATTSAGALAGLGKGIQTGVALTSFGLEYNSAVMDAITNKGYDLKDAESVAKALQDKSVWDEGMEVGLKRGIPIAAMDFFAAGMAGRVFKVSSTASKTQKIAAFGAERMVFDPASEMLGEATAMLSAGQELSVTEIIAEGIGGLGGNAPSASVNLATDGIMASRTKVADNLADVNYFVKDKASGEELSAWANNMEAIGKITPEKNQAIQRNVGLERDAVDILETGSEGKVDKDVTVRLMELAKAKEDLTSTKAKADAFKPLITEITEEIREIAAEQKLRPKAEQTNLKKEKKSNFILEPRYNSALSPNEKKIVESGGILPKSEYGFEVVPKELESSNPSSKKDGSTFFTGEQLVESGFAQNLFEADDKRKTAPVVEEVEQIALEEPSESQLQDDVKNGEVVTLTFENENDIPDVYKNKTKVKNPILITGKIQVGRRGKAKPTIMVKVEKSLVDYYESTKQVTETAPVVESAPVATTEDAAPVAKEVVAEEVAPEEEIEFSTAFNQQDATAEITVGKEKNQWGDAGFFREKIENAGDILRELSSRGKNPDPEYILEKITKLKNWVSKNKEGFEKIPEEIKSLEDFSKSNLKSTDAIDSWDYANKFYNDILTKTINEYKGIDTYTEEQKIARDLVVDLLSNNIAGLESKISTIESIANKIKEKGELTIVKNISKGLKQEAAPVAEVDTDLDEQIKELESLLKDPKIDFRLKSDDSSTSNIDEQDAAEVTVKLNLSESPMTEASIEANETEKSDPIDVDELNERTDTPFESVDMGVTKGLPHLFSISDQLRTGDTKNSLTGNLINRLKGAMGFNGTKGNETSAWANVKEDLAKKQHDNAVKLYLDNKEAFDNWWVSEEGKKYDGLVPMAIVQMGESSIMSNEATFRVLADNMTKIPEQNKIEALSLLKKNIKEKIAKLKQGIEIKKKEYNSSSAVAERKNNFKAKERKRKDSFLKKEKQKAIAANKKGKKYNPKKFVAKSFEDKEYSGGTKEFKELTKIIEVLDTYNAKSLGDIVSDKFAKKLGSLPVRARFMGLVTTGNPVSAKSAPSKVTTGGLRGVAKVLGKGVDPRLVHIQEIVNEITDPQLKNVPIGNIVSLVGIDVKSKNQGAKKVNHPNYDWGVEGRSIGILSNPAPMESVFPKAYDKIFRDFFGKQRTKKKKGETVTLDAARKAARTEQLGVGIGIPSKDYRGAYSATSVSEINKLISFLNIAFPNVEINTGMEQFNNIIASDGVKSYLKGDEIIYGVTVDGDVYINPEVHNSESQLFNTAIHEMGHVWTDYLKTTKKGKEIYAKGVELVKSTDEYKKQLEVFNGDVNKAANEALAILIGNKGETIADGSIQSKFKEWLIGMWDYIKSEFKMSSELSSEEIQNLTLDEVLGTALADIFAGEEIKLTDDQLKKMNNPDAAFSKSDSMLTIIQKGRQYGYRDAVIKALLQQRGFKATDINKALVVDVEVEVTLPLEFGNVVGGVQDGYKLFTSVREKLRKFSKDKTFIEIREKGLSLLKEEPIFQAQEKSIQNELLIGFDKSLGIKRGVEINREMSAIKNNLRQMKVGKKELKGAQAKLKNVIRTFIPKGSYNKSQVNKLIRIVEQTTIKNYDAQLERVIEVIDYQREKAKKSLIKEMVSFIKKNSKTTTTKGGLKRSTGMSARGSSFFKSAKKIISNSLNQDYDQLEASQKNIDEELVERAIIKGLNDETLTTKEQAALDEAFAYDMFSGINDMSLEQVKDIFDNLKGERDNFRADFKNRRLIKAEATKEIKREAKEQISKDFKIMYNEDGSVKSTNQLSEQHKEIWQNFSKLKIWSGIKKWASLYDFNKSSGFANYMRNNIDHLGTLTNLLDKSGKFFTNNIYNALNKMYDSHWAGFFKQRDNLDAMANSIDGIEDGYKGFISKLNPKNITLKGIMSEGKNPTDYTIDTDEAMRIYALSKNDTQRKKLLGMGFTDKKIDEIKSHIGVEAIAFTDMVVDYLSNEYYESVNDVFRFVNNTDLGYQENYFPTKTDSKKADAKSLAGENFKKNFDAETASALKERNDVQGEILLVGQRFTEVLENHFESMERYKSYAIGVQKLVALFESRDVDTLLKQTGLDKAIKDAVNFMVNPDTLIKQNPNYIDKLLSRFTRYALNFKIIQIAKQATSFVNAFEDYSYRGPGKQNILIDLPAFIIEYAATIATLPSQYKKFENISATFKKRMEDGLGGDIFGLESGTKEFKPLSKKSTKGAKFLRGYEKAGAFGTVAGDALGVMGYMVNYNRNIANGMNKEEALNKLNDYNATQQSRRGTEKSGIQLNQNTSSRVFTMFASTLFLQINKVRSSTVNITRSIMDGKTPKAKDVRALALNFAIANALFAFTSNIAKFIAGDDEDKEAGLQSVKDAAMGLNLLYQIPIIGAATEKAMNAARGSRMPVSDILNPFDKLFRDIQKAQKEEKVFIALKPIVELALGAKIDPVIGLYNMFSGDFDDGMYDLLGISKSYKPGYGRKKTKQKTIEQLDAAYRSQQKKSTKGFGKGKSGGFGKGKSGGFGKGF